MEISKWYGRFEAVADYLRSPLLLVLRVYWGWQFAQTGWGKLMNLERTAEFFGGLGIPLPKVNAFMAGGVECVGGALLVIGLASRLVSVPLAGTMVVAYVTADNEALRAIFNEPEKFTSAAPFMFLLVAVMVLAFGPGAFSLDRVLINKTETK
ncbi:DoxX family protein [Nibricoccus aquaticus]|nr:DoxX family protein [Nibricoccus aquaticus]